MKKKDSNYLKEKLTYYFWKGLGWLIGFGIVWIAIHYTSKCI